MATHGNCLLRELLGCFHIPFLTQQGIHQITIVVDRSIQIAPFSMDFEVRSSTYQDIPACPRRFVRNWFEIRGANRFSQSRTVSWAHGIRNECPQSDLSTVRDIHQWSLGPGNR
jgi:hypothetical protein